MFYSLPPDEFIENGNWDLNFPKLPQNGKHCLFQQMLTDILYYKCRGGLCHSLYDATLDTCFPYQSTWAWVPHLLPISASCLCTSWEATGDVSRTWVPVTHMGDSHSIPGFWLQQLLWTCEEWTLIHNSFSFFFKKHQNVLGTSPYTESFLSYSTNYILISFHTTHQGRHLCPVLGIGSLEMLRNPRFPESR